MMFNTVSVVVRVLVLLLLTKQNTAESPQVRSDCSCEVRGVVFSHRLSSRPYDTKYDRILGIT